MQARFPPSRDAPPDHIASTANAHLARIDDRILQPIDVRRILTEKSRTSEAVDAGVRLDVGTTRLSPRSAFSSPRSPFFPTGWQGARTCTSPAPATTRTGPVHRRGFRFVATPRPLSPCRRRLVGAGDDRASRDRHLRRKRRREIIGTRQLGLITMSLFVALPWPARRHGHRLLSLVPQPRRRRRIRARRRRCPETEDRPAGGPNAAGRGDYLKAAQQLSFHADITFDDLLPTGQKIQLAADYDVAVRRPDRVYTEYWGDAGARRFW